MKLRQLKSVADRRKFLEDKLNLKLDALSIFPKELERAQTKNST